MAAIKVTIDNKHFNDAREWCFCELPQPPKDWWIGSNTTQSAKFFFINSEFVDFFFVNSEDAALFKLIWSGK